VGRSGKKERGHSGEADGGEEVGLHGLINDGR
jgi:hypothetical protein